MKNEKTNKYKKIQKKQIYIFFDTNTYGQNTLAF
jgi:hypothetical protein